MKKSLDVPIEILNTLFAEIQIKGKDYMNINELYPEDKIVEIVKSIDETMTCECSVIIYHNLSIQLCLGFMR